MPVARRCDGSGSGTPARADRRLLWCSVQHADQRRGDKDREEGDSYGTARNALTSAEWQEFHTKATETQA
jgi:hypothetical protein